jgi:hypothetical protein
VSTLWPRPGRIFAVARTHTFAHLARPIDDAFARWDRAHLHDFSLADGTRLTTPHEDWEADAPIADDRRTKLGRLQLGERFVYVFDFGDDWTHLCTVGTERIDPLDALGIVPTEPLPWGWGDIPTNTGAAGTATMVSPLHPTTPSCPTCRPFAPGGASRQASAARAERSGPRCAHRGGSLRPFSSRRHMGEWSRASWPTPVSLVKGRVSGSYALRASACSAQSVL